MIHEINISNMREKKRDQNLDIMKGIGILLVIFAHIFHNSGIIYQFHMPLFFILSGAAMTYSSSRYSFKKKFKTLLIPYFVFSIICFVYWALIESKFRPLHDEPIFGVFEEVNIKLQQLINIFTAINCKSAFIYNIVLWFLPCLFMAELLFSIIKGTKVEWIIDVLCIIVCYVAVSSSYGWPWCLGEAVVAVPLLSLGNRFYQPLMKVLKKKTIYAMVIGVICLLAFIFIFLLLNPHTDMAHNIIPKEFYLMAILGSLCVVILSLEIDRFAIRGGQYLAYLGRNSLIIMCVHEPLKRIILMVLSKVMSMPTDVLRDEIGMSIVATLIVVAVCIPIIEIINRKISWAIGKF